jgi:hypothetical protein
MDDARKCYTEYIESEEFMKNDGWRGQLNRIAEMPAQFMSEKVWDEFDTALSGALCDLEARSFAAGFNAALRLWAGRLMESNQWSMT